MHFTMYILTLFNLYFTFNQQTFSWYWFIYVYSQFVQWSYNEAYKKKYQQIKQTDYVQQHDWISK